MALRNLIARVFGVAAVMLLLVNLVMWHSEWTSPEWQGVFSAHEMRRFVLGGFRDAILDPVFLLGTAFLIEYLARIARYLEAVGIMMKDKSLNDD